MERKDRVKDALSSVTMKYMQRLGLPVSTTDRLTDLANGATRKDLPRDNNKKCSDFAENVLNKTRVIHKFTYLPPEEKLKVQPTIKDQPNFPPLSKIDETMDEEYNFENENFQHEEMQTEAIFGYEQQSRVSWTKATDETGESSSFHLKSDFEHKPKKARRSRQFSIITESESFLRTSTNLSNIFNSANDDTRNLILTSAEETEEVEFNPISHHSKARFKLERSLFSDSKLQNASDESLELQSSSLMLESRRISSELIDYLDQKKFTTQYLFGEATSVLKKKNQAAPERNLRNPESEIDLESIKENSYESISICTAYSNQLSLKPSKHVADRFYKLLIPEDWNAVFNNIDDPETINPMTQHHELAINVLVGSQNQEIFEDLDCEDIHESLSDLEKSFDTQNYSIVSSTPLRERCPSPKKLSSQKKLSQQSERIEIADDDPDRTKSFLQAPLEDLELLGRSVRTLPNQREYLACSNSNNLNNLQSLLNNVDLNDNVNAESDEMFVQIVGHNASLATEPEFCGFNPEEQRKTEIPCSKEMWESQKLEAMSQLNPRLSDQLHYYLPSTNIYSFTFL